MSVDHVTASSELPPPEVKEVADRVFCYLQSDGSWGLNNAGFVVGNRGATVIDTCFTERRTRAFLDSIRSVTNLPLHTLVNTHHHGDHTHGNYLFRDSTIVAHELCREAVLEAGLPRPDNTIGMLFPQRRMGQPGTGRSHNDLPGQDDPVCRGPEAGANLHGPGPHD